MFENARVVGSVVNHGSGYARREVRYPLTSDFPFQLKMYHNNNATFPSVHKYYHTTIFIECADFKNIKCVALTYLNTDRKPSIY